MDAENTAKRQREPRWPRRGDDYEVEVVFRGGLEERVKLDPYNVDDGYWEAVAGRQNRYDLGDYPVAVVIDGERVPLDEDGDWLCCLDDYLDVKNIEQLDVVLRGLSYAYENEWPGAAVVDAGNGDLDVIPVSDLPDGPGQIVVARWNTLDEIGDLDALDPDLYPTEARRRLAAVLDGEKK
jgi:hypothetical protein